MPLIKSSSKPAFVSNLKAELAAGKPRDQALAIAYAVKRRKKRKGYAAGGAPDYGDIGGALPEAYADPNVGVAPILTGLARGVGNIVAAPGEAYQSTTPMTSADMIKPAADLGMMTTLGAGAVPQEANTLNMGIKAYHGSPHDFDAFDLSKIGTGEGAQAYGHGLYFADKEGTAQSYRDALGQNNKKWTVDGDVVGQYGQNNTPLGGAAARLRQVMGEDGTVTPEHIEAAKAKLLQTSANNPGLIPNVPEQLKAMDSLVGRKVGEDASGKMYEVNINADPSHFIDYDRSLADQHPIVQAALGNVNPQENIAGSIRRAFSNDMYGGDLIGAPSATPDDIAKTLAARGVPGIKYLDAGSRTPKTLLEGKPIPSDNNAAMLAAEKLDLHGTPDAAIASLRDNAANGHPYIRQTSSDAADLLASGKVAKSTPEGSSNYVVFNDKLVNIIKKYGIAGLPAGAAAAMSAKGKDDDKMNRGGSVSAAMDVARRAKRATGGKVHVGPIIGDTGGRADKVSMDVPDGCYVIPADIVSGLGQGNTDAGMRTINKLFPSRRAKGGAVSIMAAHGETVISPEQLKAKFGGDLDHAHAVMDTWVNHERQKLIKTLSQLPGPAQD